MRKLFTLLAAALMLIGCNKPNEQTMQMTQEWDKTFPLSEKVTHKKVTFENQYGITLVGDLYQPKGLSNQVPSTKCAAIAVSGPFGAVKEQ